MQWLFSFAIAYPGVITGGNVFIDEFTAISIGATIKHNIKIGKHTIIGANSLVLNNIKDYVVAYGSPTKVIRERKQGDKYL